MRKVFIAAMMVAMSMGASAQTVNRQVVEEGGTGPFKSEVVGEFSCRAPALRNAAQQHEPGLR